GFPRTIAQAEALSKLTKIDSVVSLFLEPEELIKRNTGRRVCPKDDTVYHIFMNPPRRAGLCDKCGTSLIIRADDKEEVVRTRIDRPEIAELMDDLRRTDPAVESQVPPIPPEKRIVRSYLLLLYGLFERVYILRDKNWIDEASWREWVAWIEVMCRNPLFAHVHTMTRGMFNAEFQDYVSGALARSAKTRESGGSPTSKPGA